MYKLIEGDIVKCKGNRVKACMWFGLGLLVASLLPTEFVLAVAAATLVIVSIFCVRR